MGILSPGAISSVTTAMCSEPPFLGSIFTVNVTPGRVRNSRCSPSFAARIRAVGSVTGVDCSTGAATAQQYTIEKTPIATRTDRIDTSVLLPKGGVYAICPGGDRGFLDCVLLGCRST